ncbi:surface antigen-like variable number repeat protein [Algoriphagus aquaeductus]|uniref:Surface antigen-like variable number repeat protein n=1 Tax=Algoriphagus aquaeductus TaxID=475299 RepID=A0A326S041_9BACT|nr:surface antigen-like variable number repeat protein [Algoriphagus aquaeductus]
MLGLNQIYVKRIPLDSILPALRIFLFGLFYLLQFTANGQDTSYAPITPVSPERVKVNNIYIIGNQKTQKNIILRELDFTTDYYYDLETFLGILKADEQKIYNLRLFNQVEITPLFTGPEEVEILISVKERLYILPAVIFQLADRNFAEWWTNQNRDWSRVNYGLRLNHSNVGGRNEKFRFSGQLGFTKSFDILYSKPYIDRKQKHGLSFQLTYSDQKTIPIKSEFNRQVFFTNEREDVLRKNFVSAIRYTFRRTFYNFHFATLGFQRTWINPEVLQVNPNYFQHEENNLRYLYFQYSFRHDKRDNVAYATSGELLQLTATKYGLFSNEDLNEVELSLTANRYIPINDRFHFAAGLTGSWFLSQRQPYTLVRGIGYNPNFIRGYELNVIEGQHLYVQKNSLRMKLVDVTFDISSFLQADQFNELPLKIYLSGNFDHGRVTDRNNIPENAKLTNKFLFGYGPGIDIVSSYDTVLRFEYSINNQGAGNFFFNLRAPF